MDNDQNEMTAAELAEANLRKGVRIQAEEQARFERERMIKNIGSLSDQEFQRLTSELISEYKPK
jgi:hypothetical protein